MHTNIRIHTHTHNTHTQHTHTHTHTNCASQAAPPPARESASAAAPCPAPGVPNLEVPTNLAVPLEAENTCNRRHISPRIFREHQHADVFSPSPPPSPTPGDTNSAVLKNLAGDVTFSPSPGEAPGERDEEGEEVGEVVEERGDVGEEGGGGVLRECGGGKGDSMC